MSSTATAASLDHLVLTVKDLDATISFYEKHLGMKHVSFRSKDTERHALSFGKQKINLHVSGKEFEPKAQNVQPGSGDLCFLVEQDVQGICKSLHEQGVEVLEGGGVVDRTGAQGKLKSVYIRDPDGNLVEALYDKILAVRPAVTLKLNALMVGILRPGKTVRDTITFEDVIWCKCTLNRSIDRIAKAYRDACPGIGDFRFVQADRVINGDALVGTLESKDDLAVVEVFCKQTPSGQINRGGQIPNALRDITRTVNNELPSWRQSAPATSNALLKEAPQHIARPADHPLHPSDHTRRSDPLTPPQLPVLDYTDAFRDFYFERDEGSARQSSNASTTPAIVAEWKSFNAHQRDHFAQRATKFSGFDTEDHRAFWILYYDTLQQKRSQGQDPHFNPAYTSQFVDEVTKLWPQLGKHTYRKYRDRAAETLLKRPAPPLPHAGAGNLGSQTPDNRSSSAPSVIGASQDEDTAPVTTAIPARLDLGSVFDGLTVYELESRAAKAVKILEQIVEKMNSTPSPDSAQWLELIASVKKQAEKSQTVVGVVGATGAGKSSVINAILDEERLIPTNCMRACTAVVTEISFNYQDIPYRAVVEFISRADWEKELRTLFQDLIDGNGEVSRECTNEDSEAGIAYAKLKAVYPRLTKDEMKTVTVDRLMKHENVKVLGDSRLIEDDDVSTFYKTLQKYVDSKEKVLSKGKKTDAEKAKAREMEFWPLIQVVKLYVKAPALATGAVIVDLPGVHDSNQARAAVAQGYLKKCTGLWIVAPITRAVDDKSAKTLLGDTFKRQLKMDGAYNSVTFICSKTDDISLTEAQDSLGLGDEVAPLYARSEELRTKRQDIEKEIEQLRDQKKDYRTAIDAAEEELETWEKLLEDLDDGKKVFAPREDSDTRKRKRTASRSASPRKKSKYAEIDSDEDFVASDNSDAEDDKSDSDLDDAARGEPLTEDRIRSKITDLKDTKKQGRRARATLDESISDLEARVDTIKVEQDDIDSQLSAKCIRGRNEYSRGAIQQDFASGIRELDQEIAEEEDAANFNPDMDARDYDEVAKSLPVFCVSSRGYQKLRGRLQKDKGLSSFADVDETEIPALQAHCTGLTVATRKTACKRFLNSTSQLLNSIRLWCLNDGTGMNLTKGQLDREAELLDSKLRRLDTALERAVKSVCSSIVSDLQDQVYSIMPRSIQAGTAAANEIQARWGASYDRSDRANSGLHYSTYKATVRREGTYTGSTGSNQFNEDLSEPMMKHIVAGWEKAFSRRIPVTITGIAASVAKLLTTFHDEIEKRATANGMSIASFQRLKQQLPSYRETVQDIGNAARAHITEKQKDINRAFVPKLTESMLPVYAETTAERGTGSYKRMKDAMMRHVEHARHTMYEDSAEHVKYLLKGLIKDTEDLMLTRIDEIYMAIKRDYWSVVVGYGTKDQQHGQAIPKQQRMVRSVVLTIVEKAENIMSGSDDVEEETPAEDKSVPNVDQGEDNGTQSKQDLNNVAHTERESEPADEDDDQPESESNSRPDVDATLENESKAKQEAEIPHTGRY